MSLKLTNHLTEKQKELLKRLGYYGNLNLTVQEAARLIDELIEQRREEEKLNVVPENIWYGENELSWITKENYNV